MRLIAIETTRDARTVKAFLAAHPEAQAVLNRKVTTDPVDAWCRNAKLRRLTDFPHRNGAIAC